MVMMKIPLHWPATADEGGVNDFVTTVHKLLEMKEWRSEGRF